MGMALEKALQPIGITHAQAGVLLTISRKHDATMAELARFMAVTPQAFHHIAITLERRGFIQRVRKADNRKSFYLKLTTEGRQLEKRAEVPLKTEQDKLKNQFTSRELDELYTLLVKFEATFKNTNSAQDAKEQP
jgi:MarR family 2-MHQ and catechol resistance regulon transcriptional repressor